jgi:hypothetical protein
MTQHNQRNRPWRWTLVVGAAGLLLGSPALAQVTPPSPLVPLTKFSIAGKTSASETTDTRTADYSLRFTLAPGKVLDPTSAALRLRLETDAEQPQPCGVIGLPAGCLFPDAKGVYTLSDNCRVSVKAVKGGIALRTRPDAAARECQRHAAAGQGGVAGTHRHEVWRGGRLPRPVRHHVRHRRARGRERAARSQRRQVPRRAVSAGARPWGKGWHDG